ncbi:MAG: hypothetical protein K9N47_05675 [Prosthecobacter sp.]|uniref:hypothetical protein n=1 Tax=Prosthecobacter sp. TaxID=1965333 RepID=UPI0025E4362B|nr:hypothetical protein [Prosthecobacter sp.]MCF7785590.1 hypothetical protein [Prosthecobacter sp.]
MSTYIPSVAETVLGMIGLIVLACLLAHLKKPTTPGRNEQLIRRHRRIQEHQLGEAYRDDGYTLIQTMAFVASLLGALLLAPVCFFIITVIFGAQEPRW